MESREANHKVFEVLEKLNKKSQMASEEIFTYRLGFNKFTFGETPEPDEERNILMKLHKMGAIEIISSYGNDLYY